MAHMLETLTYSPSIIAAIILIAFSIILITNFQEPTVYGQSNNEIDEKSFLYYWVTYFVNQSQHALQHEDLKMAQYDMYIAQRIIDTSNFKDKQLDSARSIINKTSGELYNGNTTSAAVGVKEALSIISEGDTMPLLQTPTIK